MSLATIIQALACNGHTWWSPFLMLSLSWLCLPVVGIMSAQISLAWADMHQKVISGARSSSLHPPKLSQVPSSLCAAAVALFGCQFSKVLTSNNARTECLCRKHAACTTSGTRSTTGALLSCCKWCCTHQRGPLLTCKAIPSTTCNSAAFAAKQCAYLPGSSLGPLPCCV